MRNKLSGTVLLLGAIALVVPVIGAISPTTRYPSPIEVALTTDGSRLFVVCEGTDEVLALDTRNGNILRRAVVGRATPPRQKEALRTRNAAD